jgi:hypothetical protein
MKIYTIWKVVHKRSPRANQTLIGEHHAHVSCIRPGAKQDRVPEAGLSKVGAIKHTMPLIM